MVLTTRRLSLITSPCQATTSSASLAGAAQSDAPNWRHSTAVCRPSQRLYVVGIGITERALSATDKSGEPRGNKDVVRWHYADLRIKAFAARSMLYRTARLADQGENIVNEAMACKVFATETVGEMVDTAIQLVGGIALVEDHPLAILYRKVRGWRLAEGASDVLRLNIGRGILELDKGRI